MQVDLIFRPASGPVDDAMFARGSVLEVEAVEMCVLSLEDVLATKLLALGEHNLDYEGVLEVARSLREQIDWEDGRARTGHSPYAAAFFTLAEGLGVVGTRSGP